jgi:thiamine pyrophosphokinase
VRVHAVIVANAPWTWRPEHVALARDADLLLAADGGANHLAAVGLRPAAVVGDLDSIRPGVRAWLGEQAMAPRPDQDHTDLEKTLAFAIDERGATRVTVLGAEGRDRAARRGRPLRAGARPS